MILARAMTIAMHRVQQLTTRFGGPVEDVLR
jgi:hypothetical protein